MNQSQNESYIKARKRIEDMKKFYRHLRIYIIVNVLLLLIKLNLFNWFKDDYDWLQSPQFNDWMGWNFLGTPVLWGIGLLAHGLYVFTFKSKPWQELKPGFLKRWEERQLERILKEEEEKVSRRD